MTQSPDTDGAARKSDEESSRARKPQRAAQQQRAIGATPDPEISLDPETPTSSRPVSSGMIERLSAHAPAVTRYTLQGEIARGGMGAILKVWDEDLRRTLAMKVILGRGKTESLSETADVDEHVLARFLEEAQVTGQLDHPGIVPVHELGLDAKGRVYFTMRLVKGRDLKEIIDLVHARADGWTQTKAISVIQKVCEAMAYAHSKGVIHRDLKPANIMVGRFGETYVMDWGLAKVIGRKDRHDLRLVKAPEAMPSLVRVERKEMVPPDSDSPLVTMDGTVVGTPAYMPPEQAKGQVEQMTVRSDVYAVGAMLYHLLSGEVPYVAKDEKLSPVTVLRMVLDGPPKPVHAINPRVAAELVAICDRAMARDPAQRYADTMEMANDLQAYLEGRVVRAYETGAVAEFRKWVDRNKGMAAALAAAVLLLVVGLVASSSLYVKANTSAELARSEKDRADSKAAEAQRNAEEAEHNADRARESEAQVRARGYVANLLAASFSLFVNDVADCKRNLEACAPELRGWEWRHLALAADSTLAVIHAPKPVTCVAFSPDGSEIVTGSDSGPALVWNARTFRRVTAIGTSNIDSSRFVISPDGSRVATASLTDRRVRIRSRETGEIIPHGLLPDAPTFPEGLAFSPDGKRLATSYSDGTVRIWNMETNAALPDLSGSIPGLPVPVKRFTSVVFSGDGTRAASGSGDGSILVWNTATGESVAVLRGHEQEVTAVAFLHDASRIVSASNDKTLRVWDVDKSVCLDVMRGHDAQVYCLAVHPNGTRIASGSNDKTVRIWNADSHHVITVLHGHEKAVKWLAYSPDGTELVSGSADATVRVWDAEMSGAVASLREPISPVPGFESQAQSGVVAVAFSPDGSKLAACLDDGRIQIWNPTKHEELAVLRGHTSSVNSVAFSHDGKHLVTGSSDRMVRTWDASTYAEGAVLRGHEKQVLCVAYSPDDARIASASDDKTVIVRDARSGDALYTLHGHSGPVLCAAFSPDGSRIVTASSDTTARIWDARTGEQVGVPLKHTKGVAFAAYSPDGKHIATCSDEILRVWRADSDEAPAALLGHDSPVRSVVFSADGTRLLSASTDNIVRLWDGRSGEPLFTLRGHDRRVRGIAISPDGSRIAAGSSGQTILLWETEPVAAHFEERRAVAAAVFAAKPLVDELFDQLIASDDVIRKLQTDTSLDAAKRDTAIRLARFRADDIELLSAQCLQTVTAPGREPKEYARGLRMAETVWVQRPQNNYFLSLLGLAQYRAGEHVKAIATLRKSDTLNRGNPRDIAVLAMAQHQAGHKEPAQKTMERLREVMKKKRWTDDKETLAFFHEAESICGGSPASSAPAK